MNLKDLQLVPETDPILHRPTVPFDFENPPVDPLELYEALRAAMIKFKGFGLSANQVGLPWSVFVFGDPKNPESVIGAFNPSVVNAENEIQGIEGCLTYPGLILKVNRAFTIRARYTTLNGVTDSIKFENLSARVFQHELDHLNGVVFTKRASKFHLDQARRKQKKAEAKVKVLKRSPPREGAWFS